MYNKKLEYKQKRVNHNEDKKLGRPRRLDFLWDIFMRRGFRRSKEIADLLGLTYQAIDYYRIQDDIKTSMLIKLLAAAQLRIRFCFSDGNGDAKPSWSSCRVVIINFNNHGASINIWKALTGRLAFLAETILKSGLSVHQFCQRYGLSYYVVMSALQRDDIYLSELEKIARVLGMVLKIEIDNL